MEGNMKNKIGKFYLDGKKIRENPEEIVIILNQLKFIPLRVEHFYCSDSFSMEGLSEKFEENAEGCAIPSYNIIVNNLDSENITVSVKNNNVAI